MKQTLGKDLAEQFPNAKETGLLEQYLEVLDTGQSKAIGEIKYGDERVEKFVFLSPGAD